MLPEGLGFKAVQPLGSGFQKVDNPVELCDNLALSCICCNFNATLAGGFVVSGCGIHGGHPRCRPEKQASFHSGFC